MNNLNFKHLRYFWMVAKTGSIARASEQLYLSPQSISGQLGELESNLGVQLLKKAGRGLELTEMGRKVFKTVFELAEERGEVRGERKTVVGLMQTTTLTNAQIAKATGLEEETVKEIRQEIMGVQQQS